MQSEYVTLHGERTSPCRVEDTFNFYFSKREERESARMGESALPPSWKDFKAEKHLPSAHTEDAGEGIKINSRHLS
jgi:hypothetical protein